MVINQESLLVDCWLQYGFDKNLMDLVAMKLVVGRYIYRYLPIYQCYVWFLRLMLTFFIFKEFTHVARPPNIKKEKIERFYRFGRHFRKCSYSSLVLEFSPITSYLLWAKDLLFLFIYSCLHSHKLNSNYFYSELKSNDPSTRFTIKKAIQIILVYTNKN